MKQIKLFALCFLLSWAVYGQSVFDLEIEIESLVFDSTNLAEQIRYDTDLLNEINEILVHNRAELARLNSVQEPEPDTISGNNFNFKVAVPLPYPIAQGVQYLETFDEAEKLRPVILAYYSERIGLCQLIYMTGSDNDIAFETNGKDDVRYMNVNTNAAYVGQPFDEDRGLPAYTKGKTLDVEIEKPLFGPKGSGQSMLCQIWLYLDDDNNVKKQIYTWMPTSNRWLNDTIKGSRKNKDIQYRGYLTTKDAAINYIGQLERRGLNDVKARLYYGL